MALGRVPDRHEWFGFPDGGLSDAPRGELVDRIAHIFSEERPDVVMTFGPDGVTGHPDHIAISHATTEAFKRFAGDGSPGFRRLTYGVVPQSMVDGVNRKRITLGLAPWDPNTTYHLRGVPDDEIGIVMDTSSVALRVRAAMQEHRTQWADMNPSGVPEEDLVKSVSRETQVIAWQRERPTTILTDVFEGL